MTEHYTYNYDAWGRPLVVLHTLDNLIPVQIHSYAYDGADRMISDERNGSAKLATTCTYIVRSWLTDIKVGGNARSYTIRGISSLAAAITRMMRTETLRRILVVSFC